jgi:DnaJ-class molecular chaperone
MTKSQTEGKGIKQKYVVCWNCRGSGIIEEGDTVDVGIGQVQVSPDISCWLCEGTGFVKINGKLHKQYRKFCMPVINHPTHH